MQLVTIRIKGVIDESWSDCFEGLKLSHPGSDETLITGLVEDQAAFYGLIGKLRDLGVLLVTVNSVDEPGDTKLETG